MVFRHHLTVRFFEVDRAGIVFFARFFEYCHVTFEELLISMLGPLEESFQAGRFYMPLVHSEADFLHPARLGEQLEVQLQVEDVTSKRLTFLYEISTMLPQSICCARIRLVHVWVDPISMTSCPIPREFLQGLQGLQLIKATEVI